MNGIDAYRKTVHETDNPQEMERQALSRITRSLERHKDDGYLSSELAEALHENSKLWTVWLGDVVDSDNELPEELRGAIANLASFVLRHTPRVLAREASVDTLLEINHSILNGKQGAPAELVE